MTKWQLDSFDGVFTFYICVSITLIVFIYWTFYYTLNWTKVKKKLDKKLMMEIKNQELISMLYIAGIRRKQ